METLETPRVHPGGWPRQWLAIRGSKDAVHASERLTCGLLGRAYCEEYVRQGLFFVITGYSGIE